MAKKVEKVLARLWVVVYSFFLRHAGLAQLVARHLAKVEVAGSNPVARSMNCRRSTLWSAAFFVTYGRCVLLAKGERSPRAQVYCHRSVSRSAGAHISPRRSVGKLPGAHIGIRRSALEHCGAGRGGLCVKHGHCGRVGCGLDAECEHCDAGRYRLQAAISRRSAVLRSVRSSAPQFFSNEFEIWACARLKLPVYYPLRLRA